MNRENTPQHAPLSYVKRNAEGEPVWGDYRIQALSQIAGQTPFYAYSRNIIAQKIVELRSCLPSNLRLHYAIKSNPMPSLVNWVASQVDGLDVTSCKELQLALASGMSPQKISMAGPAKSDADLTSAIASGITINVESPHEITRIDAIAQNLGVNSVSVAYRLNPDFLLKSSGMKMGGGAQQFGTDVEQIEQLNAQLTERIQLDGLHIFTGSQNLKAENLAEAHQKIFELVDRLLQQYSWSLHKINIGGGFGIPYFPGESPLDLNYVGDNLKSLCATYPRIANTQPIVELGRYIVGESGIYVSRVVDKKVSRGETFLMVDGGLHHHLAATGNFGQVLRKNYPCEIVSLLPKALKEKVNVVGPLCTPLDLLAKNMVLTSAEINDFFVVYQSGAYGYSSSPHLFLSHPNAVELLV
ncbi:MAG: pyridoxal-dependent decarboxylase, exosortase A system-associated [Pseudomonadota bacterium]